LRWYNRDTDGEDSSLNTGRGDGALKNFVMVLLLVVVVVVVVVVIIMKKKNYIFRVKYIFILLGSFRRSELRQLTVFIVYFEHMRKECVLILKKRGTDLQGMFWSLNRMKSVGFFILSRLHMSKPLQQNSRVLEVRSSHRGSP
jgi:heme/copper-type cytochrome/quinol oxidase subunit 4